MGNNNIVASTAIKARELTAEEIADIKHEMGHYPYKSAVGLEALKVVQKYQGWVSDESLLAVSEYLDIPAEELEGVATFFNLIFRRPVGKNVILLCDSVTCWIMGCNKVKSQLSERLNIDYGETSEDGNFTLLPVPCLGDCDCAPVMMVGQDLHRNLNEEKIDKIIEQYKS